MTMVTLTSRVTCRVQGLVERRGTVYCQSLPAPPVERGGLRTLAPVWDSHSQTSVGGEWRLWGRVVCVWV